MKNTSGDSDREYLPARLAGADAVNLRVVQSPRDRNLRKAATDQFRVRDGCFLEHARQRGPQLAVFGVDLSETAVETTKKRL